MNMSEKSLTINEQDNAMCNPDSDSCVEEVKSENYVFYVTSSLENSELQKDIVTNMNYIDMDNSNVEESSICMEDSTDYEKSPCQNSMPLDMTIEEKLATSVKSFLERACMETEVHSYRRGQRKKKSAKMKKPKHDYKTWNKNLLKSRKMDLMPQQKKQIDDAQLNDITTDENSSNMPQCNYLKNSNVDIIKNSVSPIFKKIKISANNSNNSIDYIESHQSICEDHETKRHKKVILECNSKPQHEKNNDLVKTLNFQPLSCSLIKDSLRTKTSKPPKIMKHSSPSDYLVDIKDQIIEKEESTPGLNELTVQEDNRDNVTKEQRGAKLTECKEKKNLEWNKENLQLLGIELREDELDPSDSCTMISKESNKIKDEPFYPTISELLNISGPCRDQMSPEYLLYLHKIAIKKFEDERKQVYTEEIKVEKQVNQIKTVETAVHTAINQTPICSNAVHYPNQMPALPPVYHSQRENPMPMGHQTVNQFVAPPWSPYPPRTVLPYNDPLGLQHHRKVPFVTRQDSFGEIQYEYPSALTNLKIGQVHKTHIPVTYSMEAPSSYSPLPDTIPWLLKPNSHINTYSWRNYLTSTGRYPPASVASAWSPQWARTAGRAPMVPPLLTSSINSYINSARTLLNNSNNLLNQYNAGIWDPSGLYSRTNIPIGQMPVHPQPPFPTLSEFGRAQFRGVHPGIYHQYSSSLVNNHPEQVQPSQPTQNRRRKLEEIVDRLKEVEKDN